MTNEEQQVRVWRIRNRRHGYEKDVPLEASWEVSLDPISDNFTPKEISAFDLLKQWIERVQHEYPNGLVPIYWSVRAAKHGVFEAMPFQCKLGGSPRNDFLTFFTYPEDPETGERLNWLSLPVVDKLWNSQCADKGGFIQQATGWKPSILQPFVYLPALTNFLD
ncbi:MAG: hypothetical protein KME13_10885 [Myxacorys californica WJT36-NPBG1]|jgi:hypothetical protein|nr:hypothetical protein [Myxacorys californica WJT36-NPBG1]